VGGVKKLLLHPVPLKLQEVALGSGTGPFVVFGRAPLSIRQAGRCPPDLWRRRVGLFAPSPHSLRRPLGPPSLVCGLSAALPHAKCGVGKVIPARVKVRENARSTRSGTSQLLPGRALIFLSIVVR